jgi:hypothetical protein
MIFASQPSVQVMRTRSKTIKKLTAIGASPCRRLDAEDAKQEEFQRVFA